MLIPGSGAKDALIRPIVRIVRGPEECGHEAAPLKRTPGSDNFMFPEGSNATYPLVGHAVDYVTLRATVLVRIKARFAGNGCSLAKKLPSFLYLLGVKAGPAVKRTKNNCYDLLNFFAEILELQSGQKLSGNSGWLYIIRSGSRA